MASLALKVFRLFGHARAGRYRNGCRCWGCRKATSIYRRQYYLRNQERLKAATKAYNHSEHGKATRQLRRNHRYATDASFSQKQVDQVRRRRKKYRAVLVSEAGPDGRCLHCRIPSRAVASGTRLHRPDCPLALKGANDRG